ncbi:putative oxidoreductase YhhX [Polystyrenella longa]|uniref:Putative oxidoreductase YhhX n=1 Tax=Polystyrenella longa TaxID=2528007 RepID=A0A518CN05_9PLAN|nr:Gfo/Idh/MocA family oxidoreductase [Polystyrenella longa]QDU80605.1 putative oxidoreductase YhhX [Polystyrenella longa]
MKPIKYAQIGTGHGHASKIADYQASPEFEVVGVAEPNERLKLQAMSSGKYDGIEWMSVDQILTNKDIQVIGVETKVADLLDTAEKCIAAGKHIHLDKPAGTSLPQFERLLNEAASKHLVVQMGYMYRYNPAVKMLKTFIEKGLLGEIFEIHTVMSKVLTEGSRKQLAEFKGGMMLELGCHLIDLVVDIMGEPEKVTPFLQHSSQEFDDGLNDNTLAVFEYPQALVSIKSAGLEVDGFQRRHFVVCGTKGTFHIQPLDAPSVRFALDEPQPPYKKGYQEIEFGNYKRYKVDVEELARWIRGESDPAFTYEHDLQVQKAVLQACDMPLG